MEPAGRPLSTIFRVGTSSEDAPLWEALATIDTVHGDGDLPMLPLFRDDAAGREGAYLHEALSGKPVGVSVSRRAQAPVLTCLHEIAHFLDHQALGDNSFASASAPDLADWRWATAETEAFRWLDWLRNVKDADQAHVECMMQWPELFARAYTQYVVLNGQNVELRQDLRRMQRAPENQIYRAYWADADFVPVAAAMERLFRLKGWIK